MKAELLIFNLDGTLIDVRNSHREVIRRTVQAYFGQVLGLRGNTPLVTHDDLDAFKRAGGFDTDWDLTAALIRYLLSRVKNVPRFSPDVGNIADAAHTMRRAGRRLRLTMEELRRQADFQATADQIREAGGGLAGLAKIVGQLDHPLFYYRGDLRGINVIQRLFQEFYLGRRYFARVHRMQPYFYRGPGLVEQESLFVSQTVLTQLVQDGRKAGIVTTRPYAEVQLALETYQISRFFQTIVAHEDIVAEEARLDRRGTPQSLVIPHPFSLLAAAEGLDPGGQRPAAFIADTPDKVLAARHAAESRPFAAWGVLWSTADRAALREAFREAGAERILEHPDELLAESE